MRMEYIRGLSFSLKNSNLECFSFGRILVSNINFGRILEYNVYGIDPTLRDQILIRYEKTLASTRML